MLVSEINYCNLSENEVILGRYYHFKMKLSHLYFRPGYEEYLKLCLPDNFTWLIHYFASMIGVPVINLYICLVYIETKMMNDNPNFFGRIFKSDAVTTKPKQHDTKDRIKTASDIIKSGITQSKQFCDDLNRQQYRLC